MRKNLKILLICSLFASLLASNLFAKETVTIRINGEEYSQEMPNDIESAQFLISSMADMLNLADDHIVGQDKKTTEERQRYLKEIETLKKQLKETEDKLDKATSNVTVVEKDVNELTTINTRFTPFFMVGPVLGVDKSIGMHVSFGGIYRIFRNLQLGGSLFSSVYSNTDRNFDIGLGVIVAYSLY